jgi:hypothetical protein
MSLGSQILFAILISTQSFASGQGLCAVQGKITKILDKRGRQFSFKVENVVPLEGDGACNNLDQRTLTVDMGRKSSRYRKGQLVNLKAQCYHNLTATSGVHDCYKWERVK